MFNLNESNRIVMAQHPSDMRIGVNGMCGQVWLVGLDPSNGDVYVFVGRSRKVMKILHWERGGYTMYYKRLEQGRFHPLIFVVLVKMGAEILVIHRLTVSYMSSIFLV